MKFMIKNLFARATGNEPRGPIRVLQPRGIRMAKVNVHTSVWLAGTSNMDHVGVAMF